jgi:hypothetical protein
LDGDNVSPLATRRERQGNDVIDGGATHLGTFNDSAPARRERQRNEPNDVIDGGATHLGRGTTRRQRGESGSATNPTTTSMATRPSSGS